MQPFNRILVPVDFSGPSRAALEYAVFLGSKFGAEIDVLHVWRPPEDVESRMQLLSEFKVSDAGHKMVTWLASCELHGGVEAHGRVAPGARRDVPDTVVGAVEAGSYDLVVMGTHGHQGLMHLLRGSITEEVVRRAPCPVVTVHEKSAHPEDRMVTRDEEDLGARTY